MEQPVVLLVEDESVVRHLVTQTLRKANYVVLPTGSAAEALQLFHNRPNIDLLLTDVQLDRDMNGVELAAEILNRNPAIRVLLMSGSPESAVAAEKGWTPLEKPFSTADLLERVRDALRPDTPQPG
jgi:DNA-binding NtrC family response regulator